MYGRTVFVGMVLGRFGNAIEGCFGGVLGYCFRLPTHAFEDRFWERFWWTLGWKMEPSWHQDGARIALGAVLRGLWKLLAAKTEGMRTFGGSWGCLGGLLGPSWRLDRRLGRSWGRLGPSKNRFQNRSEI